MATGTVVFQSAVTATPSAGLSVMADSVNDTDHGAGTAQYIKIMDGRTGGTIKAAVTANGLAVDAGTVQVLGTVTTALGTLTGGTVQTFGTSQVLGSVQTVGTSQVLGSVQLVGVVPIGTIAGTVSVGTIAGTVQVLGSVQGVGTFQVLGSVQTVGTSQVLGSVQTVGTSQALGTFQPLAGSVHLANTFPGGTIHIGTIAGTISVGTIAGTISALGTFQPLAGSVHLATSFPGGTIVSVGSAVHDAVADTRPHLMGGFGSSGTQAAVNDGDAVRLWADLNGRLQVRGTIDSMPAVVIASGTVGLAGGTQHIGSVQRITGGTIDFIGGTINIGTLQGTFHIGSVQRLGGGTIDQLNGTVRGTVSIAGTISGGTVTALVGGLGSYFGTAFTANATLGTLIAPPASGTRWRLFDLTISASAAGTVLIQEAATAANGTVVYGPLFFAANGGMAQPSGRGLVARAAAQGLFCSVSAGTIAVTVNYTLETP